MKVSAVSVNQTQASISNKSYKTNFSKNEKDFTDTTSYTLNSYSKKTNSEKEKNNIYDIINEWKDFCHKQILNGKIDIIA